MVSPNTFALEIRADFLQTTQPASDRMVLLGSVRTDASVETPGFLFGERIGLSNEKVYVALSTFIFTSRLLGEVS